MIGTSGYSYPAWIGRFYPADLPRSEWLSYYARHFRSVELTITSTRVPATPIFDHWRKRTPADFRFSLKGSRTITHHKRLADVKDDLFLFFERASHLEHKLAAVLWQLPPRFEADDDLFASFLAQLATMQLLFGRSYQVFEFRDPSWFHEDIYELLRVHHATIALADWPFDLRIMKPESTRLSDGQGSKVSRTKLKNSIGQGRPLIDVPQFSDTIYLRRYGSQTSIKAVKEFATIVQKMLTTADDVFVYFNHHTAGDAIDNAYKLSQAMTTD